MEDQSDTSDPLSLLINTFDILEGSVLTHSYQFLILTFLLLFSAFISAVEVAFFSLSNEDFLKIRSSKLTAFHTAGELLLKPKELLSTLIILNNLTNVSLISLCTYFFWQYFNEQWDMFIGATVWLIALIALFTEILPKIYANQNGLRIIRISSGFINLMLRLVSPINRVLLAFDNSLEKSINRRGYKVSLDELNDALDISTQHQSSEGEKEILKGVVNFSSISVKQIMNNRLDIVAIDQETNFHDLLKEITKEGYSRVPVYKETIDNIQGVLYVKDLLPFIDGPFDFNWHGLMRPGFFIPESKKIDDLLKDFQEKKVHMAIVVDEYGGTSGLVTLEDIIEEIIGDINDEFDESEEIEYSRLDDQTFIFEGKTFLADFAKISEVDAHLFDEVKADNESLGGLLLELFSRLPVVGDQITYDKFEFTVISVDEKKINRVKVYIKDQTDLTGQLVRK